MTELTIDQAAERMGISKHTLRYYEREGLLPEIAKGANGHRRYTEEDLGWVKFLQLLRGTGMPIREMKHFVSLTWAGDHTIAERVEVLERYRVALAARMEADREHMQFLNHKIDYYSGVLELENATPDAVAGERAEARL
ncbi:MAG: MerR family transcriptional regulator [Actinobacteria bacterium HGW-Actinobacteria-4]|nr:MAG: MerR family transcriptional regulator [Actinobacteria bacterium HGW-Actinobacteria-4]